MKKMRFIRLTLTAVSVIFVMDSAAHAVTRIKFTRHNLSSTGKYSIKATSETQICIFCHTPHNAERTVPLWGHAESTSTFKMASTPNVVPGGAGSGGTKRAWADSQPSGISKKCLSCHDGTIAIGALASGVTIAVTGPVGGGDKLSGTRTKGGGLLPGGDYGFIGTDLRGGHVISFDYDGFWNGVPPVVQANYNSWGSIPAADKASMFDRNKKMQCHSCHDPHNDWCNDTVTPNMVGRDPLWRKPCGGAGIGNRSVCDVCHINAPAPGFKKYSF